MSDPEAREALDDFIAEWRGLPAFEAEAGFAEPVMVVERFITRLASLPDTGAGREGLTSTDQLRAEQAGKPIPYANGAGRELREYESCERTHATGTTHFHPLRVKHLIDKFEDQQH